MQRFGPLTNQILSRLASANRQHRGVDRQVVEEAFGRHFRLLGLTPLPVRWAEDAKAAYDEMARVFWKAEEAAATAKEREEYDLYRSSFRFVGTSPMQAVEAKLRAAQASVLLAKRSTTIEAMREQASKAFQPEKQKMSWPDLKLMKWGSTYQSGRWKTAFVGSWPLAEEEAATAILFNNGRFREGLWAARSEAESAAWMALEAAYWAAAQSLANSSVPVVERYILAHLPFLQAYEAGLWCFWVCRHEVVAVPRPVVYVEDNQLHCEDGPAVSWPNGTRYYFWKGIHVPPKVIESPHSLAVADIDAEPNAEVRRVMVERFGQERYLIEGGAVKVDDTDWGTLYRRPMEDEEDLVMIKVINATAEPDGTFKDYFLRVPPHVQTAKEAVAWTFEESPDDYAPSVQT